MDSILTVTLNPSIDQSTTVDCVVPEDKLRCTEPRLDPGGGGVNVSRALRHLGGDTTALVAVGGLTGDVLVGLLRDEQVPVAPVRVAGQTRINLHVEEASGAQYRFNLPGPTLNEADLVRLLDALAAFRPAPAWVVLSGSLPRGIEPAAAARLVRQAKDVGARCIVDTSGEALAAALSEGVFLCKPNLRELGSLVGASNLDYRSAADAARELIATRRTELALVSMASDGALLVSETEAVHVRPPAVTALSRVGAGDSALAGMALSLARGEPPACAARFAVACGTAAVLRAGTQLCHADDVQAILARM